jgi:type I restriction enzyme M protein
LRPKRPRPRIEDFPCKSATTEFTNPTPYGRIKHLPPKSHGEVAFLQHLIASMNDNARLAVVLPNGVFFRGGAELAVRKDLIDADLVEAIVQLPVDLFYGAGIPACILVLNRAKPEDRKGRVLMIDNSTGFERRETKNVLTDEAVERVITTHNSGDEEEGWARWIPDEEIAGHHYNLTVRRYVSPGADADGEVLELGEAIEAYREARGKRAEAEAKLEEVLADLEEV